jgi:hypothetical protein
MVPYDAVSFARLSQEIYLERIESALKHNHVREDAADPEPRRQARSVSGVRAALRAAAAVVLFPAH